MPRIKCPNCKSSNTCRILYGLPVMTVKLTSTLKRHALPTRRYTTGKTMNIYVDIDGVLLANEESLAIGAAEFTAFCKYAL